MFLSRSPCWHVGIWAAVHRGASRTFSVLGPCPLNVPPRDDENSGPPPLPKHFHGRRALRPSSSQRPRSLCSGKGSVLSSASLHPGPSVHWVVWHPGDAREGKPQSLSARVDGIHACEWTNSLV